MNARPFFPDSGVYHQVWTATARFARRWQRQQRSCVTHDPGVSMRAMNLAARRREYDWMAAAIDLVTVVVGILIALEVSNWNKGRQDRARADGYHRRLHSDLTADNRNIDSALAFWKKVSAYESIDCRAPINEEEAASILDIYRHSDTVSQNLRSWMSTLRVSTLVLTATRRDTSHIDSEVPAARGR